MIKSKKHIAIIGEEPVGNGGVKSTVRNVKEMIKSGYDVTVITGSHKKIKNEMDSSDVEYERISPENFNPSKNQEPDTHVDKLSQKPGKVTIVELPEGLSGDGAASFEKQDTFLKKQTNFQDDHKKQAIDTLDKIQKNAGVDAILYTQSLEREERWIYDDTLEAVFKYADDNDILLTAENRPNTIQNDDDHPHGLQTEALIELHQKVDKLYVRGGELDTLDRHSDVANDESIKPNLIQIGYKSEMQIDETELPFNRIGSYWHRIGKDLFIDNNQCNTRITYSKDAKHLKDLDPSKIPGLFYTPGGTWKSEYKATYEKLIHSYGNVSSDNSIDPNIKEMKWLLQVPKDAPQEIVTGLKKLIEEKDANIDVRHENIKGKEFVTLATQSLITVTSAGQTPIKVASLNHPPAILVSPRMNGKSDTEQVRQAVNGHHKGAFTSFFHNNDDRAVKAIIEAEDKMRFSEDDKKNGEITIISDDKEQGGKEIAKLIKNEIEKQKSPEKNQPIKIKTNGAKNLVKDLSQAIGHEFVEISYESKGKLTR